MNIVTIDIATLLENSEMGFTLGTDMFISRQPNTPTNTITLYDTTDNPQSETLEGVVVWAHTIQVLVRGIDYRETMERAATVRNYLHSRTNEYIGDAKYLHIRATGLSPLFGEAKDKVFVSINFEALRTDYVGELPPSLSEIVTKIRLINGVITPGSPVDELNVTQDTKSRLKTSIEAKGVVVGDVIFSEYPGKVDDIGTGCPDAIAVLKDTGGVVLETKNIPSGDTEDLIAPNASAALKDSDGELLSTTTLKSNETKDITAPDSEAVLKDSGGVVISTTSLKSNESKDIPAPDAVAILKDTAGLVLSTTNLKSNETKDIQAPDAAYEGKYSPSNTPIESGNIVSGGSKTVLVPDPIVCEGWSPPVDWLDISGLVTTSDTNKVAFTFAVWEQGRNFLSLLCRGAYNVKIYTDATLATLISDTDLADNVQYNTELFWANTIPATFCTRGYRQVVVIVTPQGAANLTQFRTNVNHPDAGSQSGRQILAFYSALMNAVAPTNIVLTNLLMMEICEQVTGMVPSHPQNCFNAVKYLTMDFGNATVSASSVARTLYSLLELNVLNSDNITSFTNFARDNFSLIKTNAISCAGATDISNLFGQCRQLMGTTLQNTSSVQIITDINLSNFASRYFIADNLTAVTTTTNAWQNNYNLSYMEVHNLGVSFSVANSNLAYEMVVEIGDNQLKDLTGLTAQNFTITGTPASLHANIAAYAAALLAAKNWTLIF